MLVAQMLYCAMESCVAMLSKKSAKKALVSPFHVQNG